MRVFLLFSLFIGFTVACNAQSKINVSKTAEHVHVAGTKVSLVPPKGFTAANTFNGFQQSESGSSIMVVELPAGFEAVAPGFTKDNLKEKGMLLKGKEDLTLNGFEAVVVSVEQASNGVMFRKQILMFGDDDKTIMVNAVYPNDYDEYDADMRASLLTAVYDSEQAIDPMGAASFSVDVTNTRLIFAGSIMNMLAYNIDGKLPIESEDETLLIAGPSLGKVEVEDRKQYAINRLYKLPYKIDLHADSVRSVSIDGMPGYEIITTGIDDDDEKELVYEVMLFSDTLYYILVGTTDRDFEGNLAAFRQVANTFKRK